MQLLGMALMLVGLFFLLVGAVGVVRFPDVFSRSHAVGLTDSVGGLFMLSGLAVYQGVSGNMVRVLVVLLPAVSAQPGHDPCHASGGAPVGRQALDQGCGRGMMSRSSWCWWC